MTNTQMIWQKPVHTITELVVGLPTVSSSSCYLPLPSAIHVPQRPLSTRNCALCCSLQESGTGGESSRQVWNIYFIIFYFYHFHLQHSLVFNKKREDFMVICRRRMAWRHLLVWHKRLFGQRQNSALLTWGTVMSFAFWTKH